MKKAENQQIFLEVEKVIQSCWKLFSRYKTNRTKLKIYNKGVEGKATEMDVLVEQYLIRKLKPLLPSASIISEEQQFFNTQDKGKGKNKDKQSEASWTWLIDPIDGTNNFINGIEHYVVSVALIKGKETVAGWILNPRKYSFYKAYIGKGAFVQMAQLKNKQLQWGTAKSLKDCYRATSLEDSVLATTNVHGCDKVQLENFDLYQKVSAYCRSTRKMGSAAQDLCLCAEGIMDGFWQKGLKPWDTAAAAFICAESGLKVTDFDGRVFHPWSESILVAPAKSHKRLLQIVKGR